MRLRDGIAAIAADTTAASLRRLHSMALELYCTVDSRMHFVDLNPAWERTLGWSLAEMRAHPFEWFVHPEDVAATREAAQRILAKGGEIQGFENRYRCKDGSYRHLSWVSSFVDGVFLASARDITDEVRTRDSMQRKGEALAAVAEMQSRFINGGANPAWWEYTLGRLLALTGSEYGFIGTIGEDADGPFLRTKSLTNIAWNDETRAFYAAHAPAGLVFRNMKTLFGDAILHRRIVVANDVANDPRAGGRPAGHPPLDTFLALPIGEGEHMVGLVGLANRAGGYDPATVELLQPVRILLDAILRNVAAAHERSTAEARLRAVIDSAIDAIVTIDENGIIVAANPALAKLLGYQIDEVLGRNLAIFMEAPHREAHDGYLARYRETGRKGGGVVGVGREVAAVRKDGSTVPIEVVVTEYVIEGRKQFTGIMRDISARRRAEAQQRQIEAERAAFARRLAATKELQERVLEASSSGLLVLRADGRCAFSNSRLRDLVPLAAGLADAPGPALGIAKAVERLFPNQPAVRGLLGDAPAADGQRTVVRLTLRGDGGDIPVEVGASSIEIDDEAGGRERGLLLTVNDLREQEAMRAQQLLNATLENRVAELRRHQAQNEITSECVELLQNSMSLEEGMNVLSRFVERLFPEATATLYARTGEGEELVRMHHVERHAGPAPQPTMEVVQCWALRTRRAYATWPGRGYVPCQHSHEHEGGIVLCAPIVSLSNSVGLLTVRMPEAKGLGLSDDGMKAVFSQFTATVQSVSGAMSAIALRESLQRLALIDELTQVPNRRAFQGDAARAIARMRRTGEPFVVALLDIDHFKSINDTLGHEEGDRTLQQVASLMRDFFREGDLIGRIGGEEFAILLPGASPDSGARRLEQLLVRLRSTPIVAGRPVTASVGFIACGDAGKHEYDELMRRADEALYRAKETGRDRIVRAQ